MFIVLDVYDEAICEYRPRHVVIGAGTQFYPCSYNDIDKGTIINNHGSLITVKEPIDQVAIKINAIYSEAYTMFISEIESIRTTLKSRNKKRTTRK